MPRNIRTGARNDQWPGLDACLESYGITPATTVWNGERLDNTRFGDLLGPRYLAALGTADTDALRAAIGPYLVTDLEAKFTLYYADINAPFGPAHAGDCVEV